jgi:hypothetical protein
VRENNNTRERGDRNASERETIPEPVTFLLSFALSLFLSRFFLAETDNFRMDHFVLLKELER